MTASSRYKTTEGTYHMNNSTLQRDNHYRNNSVQTASPAKVLTMLYDRLVLDLVNAETALKRGDLSEVNSELGHAQDIVSELSSSLKVETWSGGPALQQIYQFVLRELISANVTKDLQKVQECRSLIEPLRDTWHEAARQLSS